MGDEEIKAAHASDTLARELMLTDGEKNYNLNFPNEETELWAEQNEKSSKYFGVSWHKGMQKWQVTRRSKVDGKMVQNGCFKVNKETKAARASDTLARDLIKKGEAGHKLNFPEAEAEVWPKKNKKRKRSECLKSQND